MRIHRSVHARFFTTVGNDVLRDNRLSYCARGVLVHLLSLPDGQRADIRRLTERTPEGRDRVASALRELERFGYLKREVKRTPDGRLYTAVDVFDSPGDPPSHVGPGAGFPAPGRLEGEPDGGHPIKERGEEPSHPEPSDNDTGGDREGGGGERVGDPVADTDADIDGGGDSEVETRASADLLARVARLEPKLPLGQGEALRLAPLVSEWRRRGASDLHLINALTAGLPHDGVHHPGRFIETRLRAKMPAERGAPRPQPECDECRAPVVVPGLCRACRQTLSGAAPARRPAAEDLAQVRSRGAALARAALRGLSIDAMLPAVA